MRGEEAFSFISDTQNLMTNCDFWLNFKAAVTMGEGYAPPGVSGGHEFA